MERGINGISKVKVSNQMFDVERFENTDTLVTELTDTCVLTYTIPVKSKKHTNIRKISVDKYIMLDLFDEIYKFIRAADRCVKIEDDCSHRIDIYYCDGHKEVFMYDVLRSDESLEAMILRAAERFKVQGPAMMNVELKSANEMIHYGKIEELMNSILNLAQSAGEDFKDNRSLFNEGLVQGYTEVMDSLALWFEQNDIGLTDFDLTDWIKHNLM